jgi:hypothetical protein
MDGLAIASFVSRSIVHHDALGGEVVRQNLHAPPFTAANVRLASTTAGVDI